MRRTAIIATTAIAACVLLVVGAYGALHSDAGARFVERQVHELTDGQLVVSGLQVAGLTHLSVDAVTLQSTGAEQADIELYDAALTFRLLPLLARRVAVDSLSVATLIVRSNPQQAQLQDAPPEQISAALPELPVSLAITGLTIATLKFEAPTFGLEGQYNVDGHLMVDRRLTAADIDLAMQRLDRVGSLSARLRFGNDVASPTVKIDFTDEDGAPLATLSGFDGGAVSVRVTGVQQGENFAVDLDWDMATGPGLAAQIVFAPGAAEASGQLRFDLSRLNWPQIDAYVGAQPIVSFTAKPDRKDGVAVTVEARMQGAQLEAAMNMALSLPRGQLLLADTMQWHVSASGSVAASADDAPLPFSLLGKGRFTDNNVVDIEALELSSGAARLDVNGTVPLADPFAARVNGQLDVADIQTLLPDLAGQAKLTFTAQKAGNNQSQLSASGKAAFAFSEGRKIDLALNGGGLLGRDGTGRIKFDLTAAPLDNLLPNTKGALQLTAIADDPLLAPRLSLRLAVPELTYAGVQTDRAEILLETLHPVADWNAVQAAASVEIVSGATQAQLATNLNWDGKVLAAQNLSIQMPGMTGEGAVRVSADTGLLASDIALRVTDLARMVDWPGLAAAQPALAGLMGNGYLRLTASGGKVSATAQLNEIAAPAAKLAVTRAQLKVHAGLNDMAQSVRAQLQAEGMQSGSIVVPSVRAELKPAQTGLAYSIETTLAAPVFARLSGAGTARVAEQTAVSLTMLKGEVESQTFALSAPAEFVFGPNGVSLSPARLLLGQGYAELAYEQMPQQVRGYVDMRDVALAPVLGSLLGLDIPLMVSGRADLNGAAAAPSFKFAMKGSVSVPDYDAPLRIDLSGQTEANAKALTLQGRVSGVEPGAVMALKANVPVNLNFASGQVGLVPQGSLSASASGALPLAPFAYLAFEDGSTLGGKLELQATVTGVVEQPAITGKLCLVDGAAGVVATGTSVQSGQGCIALKQSGAFDGVIRLSDRHEGRAQISVTGSASTPQIAGSVKLDKMRVLDGDIGRMTVDSAVDFDVRLLSAGWPGYVRGSISVLSADLPIPDNAAASVQTLNVVHINRPGSEAPPQDIQTSAVPRGSDLKLDVAIKLPGQFFLRGRGVEAEWKGDVGIGGTLAAPVISGDIGLVKGVASAGAATLAFTQGAVQIVPAARGALPNLFVNMVSESRVEGVLARMLITGPVRQPQIKFASEPSLPEDEILARLLFGKPAAQLTTSEALSLSAAALELSGAFGGGAGVLDRVRRGLGVDRLSIEASTDAPEQSKLSAGKYLTPDLYLSVRQGADGSNPDVALEYQLNENVTVTGDQKGEGGESVGVEYRLDY